MRTRFDAIVVGGGHNGLVCAAYLADAGLAVLVLERSTRLGGAAVTEEFHPGFRNSAASYTVSLLQRRVIEQLELARHGLRIVPRPIANFVPSQTGSGLMLHGDPARTREAIAGHDVSDAARYPDFVDELAAITRLVSSLMLEAPVDPAGGWRERLRLVVRAGRVARLGPKRLPALWSLLTGSAGDWLDRWFCNDLLKGALGFDAIVGQLASPYDAGCGYLLLHHALGEVDGRAGAWGHAIGGMGAISDAIAAAARQRGVTLLTDAEVERIVPGREGFELHSGGQVFSAATVAGAIHPQLLFLRLLEPGHLPSDFVERIRTWRSESATFRANVALSELPQFRCAPGAGTAPHHGSGILITPSLAYLDAACVDARAQGYSRNPVIEMLIPSTIDDTLAPHGAHVASLFCQHFRRVLPEGRRWADTKDAALDLIIDTVDDYAPNFRRAVIGVQSYDPEALEQRFALVGGDIFHGRMTLDQLYWARPAFGHAQYRTPVPGLYLCASGAHPGGGVSGAPGHNAARAILADRAARRFSRRQR
jgi:phytoene dehydrogenase-like protein